MIKKTIHLVCFEMYKVRNVEGGMIKFNLYVNLSLMSCKNWGCYVEITCDVEFGKVLVTNSFLA